MKCEGKKDIEISAIPECCSSIFYDGICIDADHKAAFANSDKGNKMK